MAQFTAPAGTDLSPDAALHLLKEGDRNDVAGGTPRDAGDVVDLAAGVSHVVADIRQLDHARLSNGFH